MARNYLHTLTDTPLGSGWLALRIVSGLARYHIAIWFVFLAGWHLMYMMAFDISIRWH
jgi:hypothetical protein